MYEDSPRVMLLTHLVEKYPSYVDEALKQIKSRDYKASLAPYSGKKLAVAICYDEKSEDKKHFVKIEELE